MMIIGDDADDDDDDDDDNEDQDVVQNNQLKTQQSVGFGGLGCILVERERASKREKHEKRKRKQQL